MVHRKKIYSQDYSTHIAQLERYVPREIKQALVIGADEGIVPVWLFQNRPAYVTLTSFHSMSPDNLDNNLEEFSHSLLKINGLHFDSLELLAELPTRYDFIFLNCEAIDCDDYALKLLAQSGMLVFQEHEEWPERTTDFREAFTKQRNKFELLSTHNRQWVIQKL